MSERIIQFSNFATAGRLKNTIAISRTVPRWYKGERDLDLAPPMDIFKAYKETGDWIQFAVDYSIYIYDEISILTTVEDYMGKILLCWCPRSEFCHRTLLAKIFERETGVKVEELGGWDISRWWKSSFEETKEFFDTTELRDIIDEENKANYEYDLKLRAAQ